MEKIELKEFSIIRLNGECDVHLKFTDNRKILVSENGYGKTTILSIFYFFLKKNKKIKSFNFDSIILKFGNNKCYIFYKEIISILFEDEIGEDLRRIDSDLVADILKTFDRNIKLSGVNGIDINDHIVATIVYFIGNGFDKARQKIQKILKLYGAMPKKDFDTLIYTTTIIQKFLDEHFYIIKNNEYEYKFEKILEEVKGIKKTIIKNEKKELINVEDYFDFIMLNLDVFNVIENVDFIYLATYRVVESNFKYLNHKDDEEEDLPYGGLHEAKEFFEDSPLIQFGVDRIQNIWDQLTDKIRTSTTEDFLKLSGSLLKNIIYNKPVTEEEKLILVNNGFSIEKVLSRLDKSSFNDQDRKNISSVINSEDFKINQNYALFYILDNMVKIYDNQKYIDEAINKYCDAVNRFFKNKKLFFNEMTSKINVVKSNNTPIDIENLSSGEKQILSLFTKIYLSNIDGEKQQYWIIFDEPEISLSIEWQQILLTEIVDSGKCELLLVATHSPFIFKNELKKYTSDLALEISEVQGGDE